MSPKSFVVASRRSSPRSLTWMSSRKFCPLVYRNINGSSGCTVRPLVTDQCGCCRLTVAGVMAAYAVVCAAVIVLRFGDLGHGGVISTSLNRSTGSLLSARHEREQVSSLTSLKDELHPQEPTGIDDRSSNGVDTQASFACFGVWMAGALAATASSSAVVASAFSNSHTETTARIALGIIAGAIGVCCTVWLQWLFFEHPQASTPLNSGFSCPLVRWVPIAGE